LKASIAQKTARDLRAVLSQTGIDFGGIRAAISLTRKRWVRNKINASLRSLDERKRRGIVTRGDATRWRIEMPRDA
jgi:hypothetical protein